MKYVGKLVNDTPEIVSEFAKNTRHLHLFLRNEI